MLFHSEIDGQAAETPEQEGEAVAQADPSVDEPLLSPQPSQTLSSFAEHTSLLDTPVVPSVHSSGDVSPFLLLAEPQLEVELETEADLSLEEAEEAKESPLNNRLSLSLITCHEGAMSAQVFADVHCDSSSFLAPPAEEELKAGGVDHSYARPVAAVEPEPFVPQPIDNCVPPAQASAVLTEGVNDLVKEASLPSAAAPSAAATVAAEQPQPSTKIPYLRIDPKSPSQVVFKPQWLGNGFGTNKPRVKSVQQGQFGKGSSSPLAVCVAVKNMSNENKGQSGKRKQKGLQIFFFQIIIVSGDKMFFFSLDNSCLSFCKGTDGRSPLQILKGANSPRSQQPQVLSTRPHFTSFCYIPPLNHSAVQEVL